MLGYVVGDVGDGVGGAREVVDGQRRLGVGDADKTVCSVSSAQEKAKHTRLNSLFFFAPERI